MFWKLYMQKIRKESSLINGREKVQHLWELNTPSKARAWYTNLTVWMSQTGQKQYMCIIRSFRSIVWSLNSQTTHNPYLIVYLSFLLAVNLNKKINWGEILSSLHIWCFNLRWYWMERHINLENVLTGWTNVPVTTVTEQIATIINRGWVAAFKVD